MYDAGDEPDYRFTLANERTFLAWLRTSLAFVAAGVALDVLTVGNDSTLHRLLSVVLVALGMVAATTAWWRWAVSERSMRHRGPLPGHRIGAAVTFVLVAVISAILLVELL